MLIGAWRVALTFFVALLHPGGVVTAREDVGALQRQLEEITRSSAIEAAIAIKDPDSGLEVLINADRVMPVAGGIRIHLIAELFRQAAAGKHALDEVRLLPESARVGGLGVLRYMSPRSVSMSLRDYATLVVTAADNSAANFLTDLVGMEAVNWSLRHQGTPEIRFQRRAMPRSEGGRSPDNVATARSTIRALELLHAGKVVNRAVSDEVIAVLSLPEVSYVRRRLPRGWRFAGLSGHGPGVRSDQGLLLLGDRSVLVCIILRSSSGKPPRFDQPSATDELMSRVWTVAVEHFARRVGGVGVAGAAP